jgi:hypothetical protein
MCFKSKCSNLVNSRVTDGLFSRSNVLSCIFMSFKYNIQLAVSFGLLALFFLNNIHSSSHNYPEKGIILLQSGLSFNKRSLNAEANILVHSHPFTSVVSSSTKIDRYNLYNSTRLKLKKMSLPPPPNRRMITSYHYILYSLNIINENCFFQTKLQN